MKSNMRAMIAIAFPVLAIGLFLANNAWVVRFGSEVALEVEAYDPRDLLAGHYLQYQVNYGQNVCKTSGAEICVCLSQPAGEGFSKAVWSGNCEQKPESGCESLLRGRCQYQRFIAGIERYYIPESWGRYFGSFRWSNTIVKGSSIKISLGSSGRGVVKEFFVQGVPLKQFILEKQQSERLR